LQYRPVAVTNASASLAEARCNGETVTVEGEMPSESGKIEAESEMRTDASAGPVDVAVGSPAREFQGEGPLPDESPASEPPAHAPEEAAFAQRGVRKILPPMITYAQNLEDVLIRRALSDIERGYYVDVGAFHPVVDSVTCWFYSQGWSGINVEPNPRFNALLRDARPHDLNLAAAVSGTTGEIELHLLDGLSTTVSDVADQHARSGRETEGRVRVPSLSLNDLFARHVGERTIDFLKIDVEGAEAAILDACPFDAVRPRLIVVEATEPDSVEQSSLAWEENLIGKGYIFCYFDGLNRYYVRQEEAWRAGLFDAPPNVFDTFRLAFTDHRVDYVASARVVFDQAPEGGIGALIAERDRWSADAQAFLAARDELSHTLQARQVTHEDEMRRERALFAQELVALVQEVAADEAERSKAHKDERETREAVIASLRSQLAGHEALIADLQDRLATSEGHATRLAADRDVSLLASARLQIKLDALRIPMWN
jgi:FkbM family methyltransferase